MRVGPTHQRAAADYLAERYGASQRRAGRVMGRARSNLRYRRARRADEPAPVREIKRLARRHPRYGWAWFRREYNAVLPHSSLGYATPREFSAACSGGAGETAH